MPKFKDPKTGQIVNVNYFLVFLSCLLFGLFFFLYIGETQHALVMVGFAILITLVGIFVSPIAILYAYIFPLIYSFIAPKIVKDKWFNKGYIALDDNEKIKIDLDGHLVSNKSNSAISQKTIEAYSLCFKILNHAPNELKKDSFFLGVSKYKDEHYHFIISNPQNLIVSLFLAREFLLANTGYNPIKNNILRVKLDENFKIVKIYNALVSDRDILRMKETLINYQNQNAA